jgi:YVTN family beta-propeller protein
MHPRLGKIVTGIFSVGAMVSAGSSWAQNAYLPSTSSSNVFVIDTQNNALKATVPVGNGPTGVAITKDGSKVFITNKTDDTVSVINASTNLVTATITVGHQPIGVTVQPNGGKAYVANSGDSTVSVIDTATNAVTSTIALISRVGNIPAEGSTSIAVAPDGSHVYVLNVADESVSVINTADDSFATAISLKLATERQLPAGGIAVTPDGSKLYVSNGNGFSLISIPSNGIISNINNDSPSSIVFSADGSLAYLSINAILVVNVSDGSFSNVFVPDPPSGFAITLNTISITPDGSSIYSTSFQNTNLIATNARTGLIEAQFTLPEGVAAVGNFIGPAQPSPLVAAILPGARSVQQGISPTVFSTIINAGPTDLSNCSISLPNGNLFGLSLAYQTTNPMTNMPSGSPNLPVTIAANGSQSFLLSFTAAGTVASETQSLVFGCDGVPAAATIIGVNTIDLLVSSTPVPDIIALSATASNDGILTVPFSSGRLGAFAIATTDNGATGLIQVSVDTGSAILPVTATICQTNPATAQCLAPAEASISVGFPAGSTPTFSVFVTATGTVPLVPASSRLFVRFNDPSGASHGSTSVAIQTD